MKKCLLTRIWAVVCHMLRYCSMFLFFLSSAVMCALIANVYNVPNMGYVAAVSWLAHIASHIECMWRLKGASPCFYGHVVITVMIMVVTVFCFDYAISTIVSITSKMGL